jgi:hypothetical protein
VSTLVLRRRQHEVCWLTAAPLWSSLLAGDGPSADDLDRMHRPTLLRLESDDFMDELVALLSKDAERLKDLEAKPRSYRARPSGAGYDYVAPIDHLKLYQAAHGHFNLVAATLVCRTVGLPDKGVDVPTREEVGFVLRRVVDGGELAWSGKDWLATQARGELVLGEQLVPLFPMPYSVGDRRRRLFVGLVPTSSIETFKNAGGALTLSPGPGDRSGDPPDRRLEELDTKVIAALDALRAPAPVTGLPASDQAAFRAAETAMRQEASRFLLLDLGDFLLHNVPGLWSALQSRERPTAGSLAAAYDLLHSSWADTIAGSSWIDALNGVWSERERIWGDAAPAPAYAVNLESSTIDRDTLRARLVQALPARTKARLEEPQPPFQAPKLDPRASARYVVRCVYRRPCCGALHPDLVSDASRPFAIASFFDFDAPARPVHISLPIDTSIAGLRKAPKNVSFLISQELRAQMGRVTDAKKALKGELSSADSFDLGMICSFSIPIITICALMVLMVFIVLLNIVFWWMPFFRICFPIPLKAKG